MKYFVIKKGSHRPFGLRFKRFKGGNLVIFGRFGLSCWHYPDDIAESGKNKLSGITFGLSGVHKNSVRIAWQPSSNHNIIDLYVYYYNNGKRSIDLFASVPVGQEFMIRMLFNNGYFIVRYADTEKKYPFTFPKTLIKYFNFPYFGGNAKAPWDMELFLKTQNSFK
jgi:hypothetical protein